MSDIINEIAPLISDKLYSRLSSNYVLTKRNSRRISIDHANTFSNHQKPRTKNLNATTTFRAISRDTQEMLGSDRSLKPCVGQYNPKYESIYAKDFAPFVRSKSGHRNKSPKVTYSICQRMMYSFNRK